MDGGEHVVTVSVAVIVANEVSPSFTTTLAGILSFMDSCKMSKSGEFEEHAKILKLLRKRSKIRIEGGNFVFDKIG